MHYLGRDDDRENDEEVLFDQAGLLNGGVINRERTPLPNGRALPIVAPLVKPGKLLHTVALFAAFFGQGVCMAIPGPTLIDLQHLLGVSFGVMGYLFAARAIGYLSGSCLGGILLDRWNRTFLVFLALVCTAVGVGVIPWCTKIGFMVVCLMSTGISMGFLEIAGNSLTNDLWGKRSKFFMQAFQFSFALGALVAPLLAQPFLSPTNELVYSANLSTRSHRESTVSDFSASARNAEGTSPHYDSRWRSKREIEAGRDPIIISLEHALNITGSITVAHQNESGIDNEESASDAFVTLPNSALIWNSSVTGNVSLSPAVGITIDLKTTEASNESQSDLSELNPTVTNETVIAANMTSSVSTASSSTTTTVASTSTTLKPRKSKPLTDGSKLDKTEDWDKIQIPKLDELPKVLPVQTTPASLTNASQIAPNVTNSNAPIGQAEITTPSIFNGSESTLNATLISVGSNTSVSNITLPSVPNATAIPTLNATNVPSNETEKGEGANTTVISLVDKVAESDKGNITIPNDLNNISSSQSLAHDSASAANSNESNTNTSLNTNASVATASMAITERPLLPELPQVTPPNLGVSNVTLADQYTSKALEVSSAVPTSNATGNTAVILEKTFDRVTSSTANTTTSSTVTSTTTTAIPLVATPQNSVDPIATDILATNSSITGVTTTGTGTSSVSMTSTESSWLSGVADKVEETVTRSRGKYRGQQVTDQESDLQPNSNSTPDPDWTTALCTTIPSSTSTTSSATTGKVTEIFTSKHNLKPITFDNDIEDRRGLMSLVHEAEKYGVTKIHIVYTIIAVYMLHVSFLFLVFLCSKTPRNHVNEPVRDNPALSLSSTHYVLFVALVFIVVFCYTSIEAVYGQYALSFAIKSELKLSKTDGAYVTALFWGSYALTRFIALFCVDKVPRLATMVASLVVCALGAFSLVSGGNDSSTALRTSSVLLGIGLANMGHTVKAWMNDCLITNGRWRNARVLTVAIASAEMVSPVTVGNLMTYSTMVLPYHVMTMSLLCALAFVAASWLRKRRAPVAKYQLANSSEEDGNEQNLQMFA